VDATLVRYYIRLGVCHTVTSVCFAENLMRIHQQFRVPRFRYVSPYGLGLFLLSWREAAFSNNQIVHELPPPPFSHPDSLECWC